MPRLKVFRTTSGFYDHVVAAPSRPAALKAWGAKTAEFFVLICPVPMPGQGSARPDPDNRQFDQLGRSRLFQLQSHERHRAVGVAAVDRLDLPGNEIEGIEPTDAQLEVGRDAEVAD